MIHGLTDRHAAFPEIGQIRKGAKKTDAKKPGPDLDYFRFVADAPTMAAFKEQFGDKPQEIRFLSPFNTAAEVFEAWKEEYTASSLKHRCDGVNTVMVQLPNGQYSTTPKPCPGGCKQTGRLKIVIPQLNRLGFITVHTTSIWDILTIHQNLTAIEMLRGSLRGVPLVLKRVPREISTPSGSNGGRARREKWLLSIEAAPEWVEKQLVGMQQQALLSAGGNEPLQLTSGAAVVDDDENDEAEVPCSPEVASAIESLWPVYGFRQTGKTTPTPLPEFLKKNKGVDALNLLNADSAAKLLELLQKRELDAQSKHSPSTESNPVSEMNYICGNDLAAKVLEAEARIANLGVDQLGIKAEWEAHAGTLHTLDTCNKETAEAWLEILKAWASLLESK